MPKLLATFVLVAFALLAILWMNARGAPSQGASQPEQDAAPSAASAAAGAPDPEPSSADPAPERTALAADAPTAVPGDTTWIEVTIVDQATQEPVAAAEVDWIDATSWSRAELAEAEKQRLLLRPDLFARRHGWHARSDASGRARIAVGRYATLFARSDGRYGTMYLDPAAEAPPGGHRLEIAPDRTLRVQVVDAAGTPAADVRVAIALHAADGRLLQIAESRATEGPDGLVEFAHLQQLREQVRGENAGTAVAERRVRIWMPGCDDPGEPFDRDAPPAEPIVLRLPPCGTVRARLLLQGRPLSMDHSIAMFAGEVDDHTAHNDAWDRRAGEDGWAEFTRVPLGRTYTVIGRLPGRSLVRATAGPRHHGERVDLEIDVAEGQIVLMGRLLDEHGQPLRSAHLTLEIVSDGINGTILLQTDAEGRWIQVFAGKRKLRITGFEIRAHGPVRRARLDPVELDRGVHDVGDLRLQLDELVVSGRWVSGGQPLRDRVGFYVEHFDVAADGWRALQQLMPVQSGDGTFAVYGQVPADRLRLRFDSPQHVPREPLAFTKGATDLVVEIDRGGALTVTALLGEATEGLIARLRRAQGPGIEQASRSKRRLDATPWEIGAGRHRFRWQGLPHGRYVLEFRGWGQLAPALVIEDVEVPPPEGGDPRLRDVDLRSVLATSTLRVTLPDGSAPTDGAALVFPWPLADGDAECQEVLGGVARIPLAGPSEFVVAMRGYRPQVVRAVPGEVAVRLQPWPEVELSFGELPPLPAGVRLQVWLHFETREAGAYRFRGGGGSNRHSMFVPPTKAVEIDSGTVRLPAGDEPGRLTLLLRGPGQRQWASVQGVTPADIVASPTPIPVHIPAESFARALRELEAKAPASGR